MKVYKIICRGGQIFYCNTPELLRTFVKNFPLPDVQINTEEMSEKEYYSISASAESIKYFGQE